MAYGGGGSKPKPDPVEVRRAELRDLECMKSRGGYKAVS